MLKVVVPCVPFLRLDELSWGVVIRDVETETVGHSSGNALTETERVSTAEVSTFTVGIVQCVEEKRRGWAEKVLDVLLKCVHCFSRWILCSLYNT